MSSFSNSFELPSVKTEYDTDNENSNKRERLIWNSENTKQLIEIFEKECKELWDNKHPANKNRVARHEKHEYLANKFGTTAVEISRKLHNLRTQFNNELRKIKLKQTGGEATPGSSGWEYFDALMFLMREPLVDATDGIDGVNPELAEFQAHEDVEFGCRASLSITNSPPRTRRPRVAASGPVHRCLQALIRCCGQKNLAQNCDLETILMNVFGDFVASELRTLRSDESRKRLKRIIQKAILEIGEEEDMNIIYG